MSDLQELLKLLLAAVNHSDGVLELSAADLRAPEHGEGVLVERAPGQVTLRRIGKSSELHWLGREEATEVHSAKSPAAEDVNRTPMLVTDELMAQAEEAFRSRRRQ